MAGEVAFRLLLVPADGMPHFKRADVNTRNAAIKEGTALIDSGVAKAVIIYRGQKPTQLLVYRPKVYVHIERI